MKEKRRQSAQRSRQRKSEYICTLENENAALKKEVARLRQQLAAASKAGAPKRNASSSSQVRTRGALRLAPAAGRGDTGVREPGSPAVAGTQPVS